MSIKDWIKDRVADTGHVPQKWVDQREERIWRSGGDVNDGSRTSEPMPGLVFQVYGDSLRRELNVYTTFQQNERGHGEFKHRSTRGGR